MMTDRETTDTATMRPPDRPRVLIVDDDEVVRMLLHEICEEYGWNSVNAATDADAILAAGLQHFDLILLDFHIGHGDGLARVRQLRDVCPATPIVVVTGESPERLAKAIAQAGGQGVVGKPCSVADVGVLLGRYRPTRPSATVTL